MISKTVNRIYQGRIVKVELKNNTDWEEYKNWQSLLLNHHEIFQDAVNYLYWPPIEYTLGLANFLYSTGLFIPSPE